MQKSKNNTIDITTEDQGEIQDIAILSTEPKDKLERLISLIVGAVKGKKYGKAGVSNIALSFAEELNNNIFLGEEWVEGKKRHIHILDGLECHRNERKDKLAAAVRLQLT